MSLLKDLSPSHTTTLLKASMNLIHEKNIFKDRQYFHVLILFLIGYVLLRKWNFQAAFLFIFVFNFSLSNVASVIVSLVWPFYFVVLQPSKC